MNYEDCSWERQFDPNSLLSEAVSVQPIINRIWFHFGDNQTELWCNLIQFDDKLLTLQKISGRIFSWADLTVHKMFSCFGQASSLFTSNKQNFKMSTRIATMLVRVPHFKLLCCRNVFKCFIIMWVPKLFFVRSGLSQQLHWKCQPAVISDQVADKLMFQPLSFTWDDLIICFSPCSLSSLMALLWLLHGTKDHTCVKSHYHNSESCHAI